MRASFSVTNFGSVAIKSILGRERKFRLLSSWHLALSTSHSSSEDEVFVPEENPMSLDNQELPKSLKCIPTECEERSSRSAFTLNENGNGIYHLGIQEDCSSVYENPENSVVENELKRMKLILTRRGWNLGSPDSSVRIQFDQYSIVQILNDLYDDSGDAALALSFFRWCEDYWGMTHGIKPIFVMIHILVSGNLNYRAIDLILYLVRKNDGEDWWLNLLLKVLLETYTSRKVLETIYSMLVNGYVREKMINVALKLAYKMKHVKLFPSIGVCNSLLKALLQMDQMDLAWDFLEEMQSQGISLNVYIISLFIHKYCVKGDLASAWKLLVAMQQHGISPDIVAYTMLIDSLCKMALMEEAISLLFKLSLMGISIDSVSVSSVIDCLCKVGQMEKALNILEIFSLPPNIYVYNSFISKFCNDNNMAAASSTLHEMSELGLFPDCFIYTTVMSGYCKIRDVNMALSFLAKMLKRGIEPSVTTYTTLIDYSCRSGELHIAENLFRIIVAEGLQPDIIAYNTLLDGYGKEGHLQKVFVLLDMMKSAGVSPDNITYNMVINSLILQGYVSEANELLDELTRRGFSPDIVTYTNIASGYAKKGKFEEAFLVWHCMSEYSVKPDVIICSALLNGYCKARRMEEANALYNKMISAGLIPDLVLYNTLIHGFCSLGNINDACSLVNSMVKQGVFPNDITHRALILGYEKKRIQYPAEAAAFKLREILLKCIIRK